MLTGSREIMDIVPWGDLPLQITVRRQVVEPEEAVRLLQAGEGNGWDGILAYGVDLPLVEVLVRWGLPVVAVEEGASPERVRDLFKAGVRDCVDLSSGPLRFLPALQEIQQEVISQRQAVAGGGRITGIVSPKGGTGVTLLAVNLAVGLASRSGGAARVALVDLDAEKRDAEFLLGVEPQRRLPDLLPVLDEMSQEVLDKVAYPGPGGLHFLGAAPGEDVFRGPDGGERLGELLDGIGRGYHQVLVDLSGSGRDNLPDVAARCDRLLLVVTADSLCLNATRLYLEEMAERGISRERFSLVVNRSRPGKEEIRPEFASRLVGLPLAGKIPGSYWDIQGALNRREVPILKRRKSPFNQAITTMLDAMTGTRSARTRWAWWKPWRWALR